MSWATEEFVDLGDKRLNRRMIKLAEQFARQPMASIPGTCGEWANTQAAYRFFASQGIDWRDILAPHWESPRRRMSEYPVVLCLQDTTELDFNGQGIVGLGRLSYEAQRGMYLHPTYAVTPKPGHPQSLQHGLLSIAARDTQNSENSYTPMRGLLTDA